MTGALEKAARAAEQAYVSTGEYVDFEVIARAVLMAVLPDIDDRLAKAQVRVYLRAILNEEPK